MTLNRLADTPISTVKLHSTLDLECGWIGRISGNPDQNQPLLVRCGSIVNDLSPCESCMTVEDLLRGRRLVGNGPMVDRRLCNHSNN